MNASAAKRASFLASIALLCFGALTAIALVGWFSQATDDPWTWKSVLALLCSIGGVATSALVWRAPTRMLVNVGIAIIIVSLGRVGPPNEWTWRSFALIAITLVMLMPLLHATMVLKKDA